MGRPRNADGRQTRQAILDASLTLFAEKGYFGTSLRDIAGAVGVRESALYNYFPGKEALFNALFDAVFEERFQLVATLTVDASSNPQVLLERVTAVMLDDFVEPRQQQLFRVLLADGIRMAREGRVNLSDRVTSGTSPIHLVMRRLVESGHLRRQSSQLLVSQFTGPLLFWRHLHALNPKSTLIGNRRRFIREHVSHFLHGAAVSRPRFVARPMPAPTRRASATRQRRRPVSAAR